MAKRKVDQAEATAPTTTPVSTHSPSFWETYQKQILYGVAAIAGLYVLYAGYKNMIVEPKQKEAVAAMWKAEQMFGRDSFTQALNSPGLEADGFLAIIDKYGSTKAGNTAKYYAAVCYLNTGDFDNAIKYMEDFDAEGDIFPTMKYGILGDCYSEKQDFDKALAMYEKAADATDNEAVVPVYLKKFALLSEKQGKKDDALKAYERIRADYPNQMSADWREVEKYIYRSGGAK